MIHSIHSDHRTGPEREAGPQRSPAVRLTEVTRRYGRGRSAVAALDRITLTIAAGEFVCVVGESGCGKSSLLSLIAGLDQPSAGEVNTFERRVALMFQQPALFPWLSAAANVELALRARAVPRAQGHQRATHLLQTVGLADFADKRPHQLSGGMQQRVALARALAQDADVVLMDEPFGALDALTRDRLHDELERIVDERGLTVVFVTHNVGEAVRLADRVILLSPRPGRIAEEFAVPVPRHQRVNTPAIAELADHISARLRNQGNRSGAQ